MAIDDVLSEIRSISSIECGEDASKYFPFAEGYTNLNHGAYGVTPISVRSVYRYYQERVEARPDVFTRYEYRPFLLDESRKAMAAFLGVPMDTCVFVPNSTTAFDTIVRNLTFKPGDVIIYLATGYEAFCNTIIYLTETTPVESKEIEYTFPVSDDELCDTFIKSLEHLRTIGKRPRMAVFDTVASLPAVRIPFERLTEICKAQQILSCIDGAHGVGQLDLKLSQLDPDFFISNLHKWLYVPRSCAVLYVPTRNQHLLRTTLPTGFKFQPLSEPPTKTPTRAPGTNAFTDNFASTATLDDSSYLCVQAALAFRQKIRWSAHDLTGEEAITSYTQHLAQRAGQIISAALGTTTLDNAAHTLTRCSLANIRLPVADADPAVGAWVQEQMTVGRQTAVTVFWYAGAWWVRVSAQTYLTEGDLVRAGEFLREICERAERGEWRG